MLREAELFVAAEDMLVEVLGRIRAEDWDLVLPPLLDVPGADEPTPVRRAVERHAADEAWVPELLAGRTMDEVGRDRFAGDLLGEDPQGSVTRLAEESCQAVRRVTAGDAVVHSGEGDVPARHYLRRITIVRCFLAHNVAMYLGSTACPLPEELARGLWELTAPEAQSWRELGVFRDPLSLPEHVSWRDRFLRTAGRDPHPVLH